MPVFFYQGDSVTRKLLCFIIRAIKRDRELGFILFTSYVKLATSFNRIYNSLPTFVTMLWIEGTEKVMTIIIFGKVFLQNAKKAVQSKGLVVL